MTEPRYPSRRICVVLLSGIGDVVNGLPVVNALKRDDPGRRITWIVQSEAAPLLRPHPSVDEVVTFDRRRGWSELRRIRRELKRREFDLVMNLNIYFKSTIPTYLAKAPRKLGFDRDRARDAVWLFVNDRLPPRPARHRVDMYLEFVEHLGLEPRPVEWRLAPTDEERDAQARYFGRSDDRPVIGVVSTSGRPGKDWPVERFSELALALRDDPGARVLLLGGPGARERERAREIGRRAKGAVEDELGDDLRRLVWLIDGCDLVIAPDTGPLHIARALEVPVIGLYGHTDPNLCGPYRDPFDLTIDRFNFDAPDRPSPSGRPTPDDDRMSRITVPDVLAKVARGLRGGETAASGDRDRSAPRAAGERHDGSGHVDGVAP